MGRKKTVVYLWPLITFIGLLFYKDYLIDEYRSRLFFNLSTDCLLVTIMFVLSIKREHQWLQWMQSLAAGLIIFYHLADTCVYIAIQSRLTLNNLIGNVEYYNVFIYFLSTKIIILFLAVLLVPIILRNFKFNFPYPESTTNILSIEILVVFLIGYFVFNNYYTPYSGSGVIDLSTNSFQATSVTQNSLNTINNNPSLIQRIDNYFNGKNWDNLPRDNSSKPNIIIVISESLSMVDSKYAGGLFNRLPMIDKIQQDGMVFKHTVSNGKITVHGLAASLLGLQTTRTGGYSGMMEQFTPAKFPGNNIVSYAKNAGYNTIMISPDAPVPFQQIIAWFRTIGFETIYDIDSDLFSAAPRFTWDAPSDQAMYDVALKMLPTLKSPYFLVIETVSLHQPYILPDLKYRISDNDLLNQINYVDGTTYNFYEGLKQQGFLDNGLFILYGDHRRFEPLEQAEIDNGGYPVWHERIISSIVGKGIAPHSVYDAPFSLIDMNTLLHYIIAGQPVNNNTILEAGLSKQLGIESPFSISLVEDDEGTYLIRSEENPPLYISIYGDIPFDKIPNSTYQDATTYLIKNDQQVNAKLSVPNEVK